MTNEEIAANFANHEQRIVGAEHRVKDLEEEQKQIRELTVSVRELAISVKSMVNEQLEQGERIKKLESEPADKWKNMQKQIFNTIIGVLAGAVASGLILLISQNI